MALKSFQTLFIILLLAFFLSFKLAKATCTTCNSTGGVCTKGGLCMCNLWYYGDDCSSVIAPSSRKTLVDGGITGGDLAGIVIAWMFGLPALFCFGFFLIAKYTN